MIAEKKERDLIVEMLGEKRVTAEQARRLFDAVERCTDRADGEEDSIFSPNNMDFDTVAGGTNSQIRMVSEALGRAMVWDLAMPKTNRQMM